MTSFPTPEVVLKTAHAMVYDPLIERYSIEYGLGPECLRLSVDMQVLPYAEIYLFGRPATGDRFRHVIGTPDVVNDADHRLNSWRWFLDADQLDALIARLDNPPVKDFAP